jgi:hypothetical protein
VPNGVLDLSLQWFVAGVFFTCGKGSLNRNYHVLRLASSKLNINAY